MTWELAQDIIFDALKDSVLVFAFVFLIHILLSFFENRIVYFLTKNRKTSVLFGSLFGIIPQCGTSVLGADLYIKKYISLGTIIALFLSCSDEALIAILASGNPGKMFMVLPLVGLKFAIGFIVGIIIDLIYRKQTFVDASNFHSEETCHSHHTHNTLMHKSLVHPLIHSLEVFIYVLIINLFLGFLIGFIGEETFASFLMSNRYLTPLYASIIGLIPNCASSLLLSELFIDGSISFGALLSGLLVNAGLGTMVLIKNKETLKKVPLILGISITVSLLAGYITCLINGF